MTINNNSVEQINVALLDMDKKLKSAISKSASASDFNDLEASVDNIKRTLNETKTGLEPGKTYNINISGNAATADKAKEAEKANKLVNALTVNGETYDGSEAVDAGVQKIENGGTGVTTQADINKAFISNLEAGNSDVTDGTEFVSSYASENGFADSNALNKPYKRQFIKVWNYIKDKISSVLGLTKDTYGGNAAKATTADKVSNALTVNGETYDGSSAVDAGVQTVANGGTGVTTQADINKAFIGNLDTGESDVTDGTEFVSSWASDNGFAYTEAVNTPFKRKFIKVWNYIKDKISSVLGLTKDNYGGKAATATKFEDENNVIQYKAASLNGYKIQDTQAKALYVEGRESNTGDSGGIAITNDGVTVFGAGDTDGVFRVINEDNVSAGPVFKVMKDGQVYTTNTIHGSIDGKAATATKASFLDEYPGAGGTRLTSGNIVPKDASEYGGMRKDVVTDTMTDSGRPGQDGHLLTMFWDNSGRYDSQLYISNDGNHPGVKVRYKSNGTDYGAWTDIITSNNIGSQTVAKAASAGNAGTADSLFYRHGNEINFKGGAHTQCWFNYRNADTEGPSPVATMEYRFCNYSGDTTKSVLMAGSFDGTTAKASSKMVIPIGAPSSLEDGCIWIER